MLVKDKKLSSYSIFLNSNLISNQRFHITYPVRDEHNPIPALPLVVTA